MSYLKKKFEEAKAKLKFKQAGRGHKLTESTSNYVDTSLNTAKPAARVAPSSGAQMAGAAAIQRVEQQQRNRPTMTNRSYNVIRAEALKELEEETRLKELKIKEETNQVVQDIPPVLSVSGVFFTCPLIGSEVLPKAEIEAKIREYLYLQLTEEPGLAAPWIIQTCNRDKEKVKVAVETLSKCLSNVIENSSEEKYRKIRVSSKAFQEKIKPIEGAVEFLLAAGFQSKMLPVDGGMDEYYVLPEEKVQNLAELKDLLEILTNCQPIRPELVRNVCVLAPAALYQPVELPSEFYIITKEELKREQLLKSEEVEKITMLRTKEMREREAQRELRRYRFCLIRIRFPDSLILQGTFKTWEKLPALKEFIREHLHHDLPFTLTTATGQQLTNEEATLAELGLAPACIVNFAWEQSIAKDIEESFDNQFLKPETLMLRSEGLN